MMHIGVGVGDEVVVFVKLFRARNVSKQGAIISAKISGDRGRAERIHSRLTRNGQVTSLLTRTLHGPSTSDKDYEVTGWNGF